MIATKNKEQSEVSQAAYPMYIRWMYTDTAKNAILLIFNRGSEL